MDANPATMSVPRFALFLMLMGAAPMANADDAAPKPDPAVAEVLQVLEQRDTYAAIERIERHGSPGEVCRLFHAAAQGAFGSRKDVRAMTALFRAGIQFSLREAERVRASDPEQAADLSGRAKAMAYDLGANLWPGWQESGIELTAADLATGLEAARLNLRLAEELGRPALARCNAHWLVGAHELARRETSAATTQFSLAIDQAKLAGRPDFAEMCGGYAAVSSLAADPADRATEARLQACVQALRAMKTDDATFFAEQLASVRAYFVDKRP
jgi:hypothetical protein